MSGPQTVGDIGEFGLIDRIAGVVGPGHAVVGVGDDAAVIDQPGDGYLLVTIDMLVRGIHFRTESDPFDLGRRALAVNLSDIAAMGGLPTYALTSIALPPDTALSVVEHLFQGIRQEADEFGVGVVGGNVSRTDGPLVIDVAVLGRVPKGEVVLRSGARVGDVVAVTGFLGDAAAARLAGESPELRGDPDFRSFLRQHAVPRPRIMAGRALASGHLVHAMQDISDGLGSDVHHLAAASGVGAVIYADQIPVSVTARRITQLLAVNPDELALYGGEDYELLLALPEDALGAAQQALGDVPLYTVGTVLAPEHGVVLEQVGGKRTPLPAGGWTHF